MEKIALTVVLVKGDNKEDAVKILDGIKPTENLEISRPSRCFEEFGFQNLKGKEQPKGRVNLENNAVLLTIDGHAPVVIATRKDEELTVIVFHHIDYYCSPLDINGKVLGGSNADEVFFKRRLQYLNSLDDSILVYNACNNSLFDKFLENLDICIQNFRDRFEQNSKK